MNYCTNCGVELPIDAKFCPKCGTSINNEGINMEITDVLKSEYIPQSIEGKLIKPIKGCERTFVLCDKELHISAEIDTFNAYRKEFKDLAKICSDNAVHEYLDNIHDFDSFTVNFLDIYNHNLEMLTKKAVDVLVAEDIYTITYEDFTNYHKNNFRYALDDYDAMMESCRLTEESNSNLSSNLSSALQGVAGNMINKNTRGMANSLLNRMADGMMENAVASASKINETQKRELYARITPHTLFNRILADYWNVYLSLAIILKQNGISIFIPSKDTNNAVFNNLSNPNFNQDKLVEVLLDIVKTNPYNEKYYEFMKDKFGETEEVKCIIEYFGYSGNSITYKEEDYPKILVQNMTQSVSNTEEANLSTEFKGAMDSVLQTAKNSDFAKSLVKKFGFKK